MNKERIMQNDKDDNISKKIEFQYSSNSHDSLLQSDQANLNITTTSSTDDLTRTNQVLSSTFHSKDSALGLSDDNLNQFISQEEQLNTSSLNLFQDKSKFHFLNIYIYHRNQRLNIKSSISNCHAYTFFFFCLVQLSLDFLSFIVSVYH